MTPAGWSASCPCGGSSPSRWKSQLREVMHPRVIALPATATVLDACEFFVLHKLLAFPVVDERRKSSG